MGTKETYIDNKLSSLNVKDRFVRDPYFSRYKEINEKLTV